MSTQSTSRRTRAWRLAAVAALAAVAVAVAVGASASGGGSPTAADTAVSSAPAGRLAGIPERRGVLGDPSAAVTVVEFVDPQCPVCATAAASVLPAVLDGYVRTGEVKLEARVLQFLGPDSVEAARFAAGAQAQDRLWPFLETFFAAQGTEGSGYVTPAFLRSVAEAAGVDAARATAYAGTDGAADALNRANAEAERLGVRSTPTFVVERADGSRSVLASGLPTADALTAALDRELAR